MYKDIASAAFVRNAYFEIKEGVNNSLLQAGFYEEGILKCIFMAAMCSR